MPLNVQAVFELLDLGLGSRLGSRKAVQLCPDGDFCYPSKAGGCLHLLGLWEMALPQEGKC